MIEMISGGAQSRLQPIEFVLAVLLISGLIPNSASTEPLSVTLVDTTGDPATWESFDAGDMVEGRIYFGSAFKGTDFEFSATSADPFWNDGQFLSVGGSFVNIEPDVAISYINAGTVGMTLAEPSTEISRVGDYSTNHNVDWDVGDRVIVHRAYDFRAEGLSLPEEVACLGSCSWLFGVYMSTTEGFGDEFANAFSSFGVVSRHPWDSTFGTLSRDDVGEQNADILYFRNRFAGYSVATAFGPRVAALEKIEDLSAAANFDENGRYKLVVETSSGSSGSTPDRGGLLGQIGFPVQSYPGLKGGPFTEFFVEPRDLTGARFRTELAETDDTSVVEARWVLQDVNGALAATATVSLTTDELDWRPVNSDFSDVDAESPFDMTQVADSWLEFFAVPGTDEPLPAASIVIDRIDIEVRQPKVMLRADDSILRAGETTMLRWRSAEAADCTGSGLLPTELPLNGTWEIDTTGTATIECNSENADTIPATDTAIVRPADKSVGFADAIGDGSGGLDVVGLSLDIGPDGWYQLTVEADAGSPFPVGKAGTTVRLYNGDTEEYDITSAVLFGENGPPQQPGQLRGLEVFFETPSERAVISGQAAKLDDWNIGDRIALDTTVFGNPIAGDFDRISLISAGPTTGYTASDSFDQGLMAALFEPEYQRYSDVAPDHWAFDFIELLASSGITSGCGATLFCPEGAVSRAQMAVFLERGIRGSAYTPPPATGTEFLDVPANAFASGFIEQLFRDGITAGCGGGNYCPDATVTRAEMAIFLLRALHGAGYSPPMAIGEFGDVPVGYWAAAWIEQLATEGITSGCGGGNYCPDASVTRAQMAVFLARAFAL